MSEIGSMEEETECAECGEKIKGFPHGWYSIAGRGAVFDTKECMTRWAQKHNVPLDTQYVRWR